MQRTQYLFQLLHEGLSKKLFHRTDINKAIKILSQDSFNLKPIATNNAEPGKGNAPDDNKAFFFLSTARNKKSGFIDNTRPPAVMFNLDGDALSDIVSGESQAFFSQRARLVDPKQDEQEDRILSKKPTIEPASKYIEEIHVVITERSGKLKRILNLANQLNIPYFVYDNLKDWQLQNKKEAMEIDLSDFEQEDPVSASEFKTPPKALQAANAITKFIKEKRQSNAKKAFENLSGQEKDIIQEISRDADALDFYLNKLGRKKDKDDAQQSVQALFAEMRKAGIKDQEELVKWLEDKL